MDELGDCDKEQKKKIIIKLNAKVMETECSIFFIYFLKKHPVNTDTLMKR